MKRKLNRGIKIDWYQKIEKPIRPLVKLLRDNGYNTLCSCGHEMYVECEYHFELTYDLFNLLYDSGYRNFKIEITVGRNNKIGVFKRLSVRLLKRDGLYYKR